MQASLLKWFAKTDDDKEVKERTLAHSTASGKVNRRLLASERKARKVATPTATTRRPVAQKVRPVELAAATTITESGRSGIGASPKDPLCEFIDMEKDDVVIEKGTDIYQSPVNDVVMPPTLGNNQVDDQQDNRLDVAKIQQAELSLNTPNNIIHDDNEPEGGGGDDTQQANDYEALRMKNIEENQR